MNTGMPKQILLSHQVHIPLLRIPVRHSARTSTLSTCILQDDGQERQAAVSTQNVISVLQERDVSVTLLHFEQLHMGIQAPTLGAQLTKHGLWPGSVIMTWYWKHRITRALGTH